MDTLLHRYKIGFLYSKSMRNNFSCLGSDVFFDIYIHAIYLNLELNFCRLSLQILRQTYQPKVETKKTHFRNKKITYLIHNTLRITVITMKKRKG